MPGREAGRAPSGPLPHPAGQVAVQPERREPCRAVGGSRCGHGALHRGLLRPVEAQAARAARSSPRQRGLGKLTLGPVVIGWWEKPQPLIGRLENFEKPALLPADRALPAPRLPVTPSPRVPGELVLPKHLPRLRGGLASPGLLVLAFRSTRLLPVFSYRREIFLSSDYPGKTMQKRGLGSFIFPSSSFFGACLNVVSGSYVYLFVMEHVV